MTLLLCQHAVHRSVPLLPLVAFAFAFIGQPDVAFPDGNVVVELLADGTLEITGDNQFNGIEVYVPSTQPGQTKSIRVVGTAFGTEPTTINGRTDFTVAETLVRGVVVSMGGNWDSVILRGDDSDNPLIVAGDLEVQMGQARDFFSMFNVAVFGQATINTGQQDDIVRIRDCYIDEDLLVDTGNNGQPVFEEEVFISTIAVGGNTCVFTGHGADYVSVYASDFAGTLAIGMGQGDDRLGFPLFGPTEDPTTTASRVLLSGGQGDDTLWGASILVAGEIDVAAFESVNP